MPTKPRPHRRPRPKPPSPSQAAQMAAALRAFYGTGTGPESPQNGTVADARASKNAP